MWNTQTTKYYSAWKRGEIFIHATTWMNLVNPMLHTVNQTQKGKYQYCVSPLTRYPEEAKPQKQTEAGKGDNWGWDGWMASLTRWTWVWANSGRWWRTGKPAELQSTGLQRVGHNLATEQQQHRNRKQNGTCQGLGRWGWRVAFSGYRVSIREDAKSSGDGERWWFHNTVNIWIYLMS